MSKDFSRTFGKAVGGWINSQQWLEQVLDMAKYTFETMDTKMDDLYNFQNPNMIEEQAIDIY